MPEAVRQAFIAAFTRSDGSLDTGKASAFSALAVRRFNQNNSAAGRIGAALGRSGLKSPTKGLFECACFTVSSAGSRATIKKLTETFGSRPLVSIGLTRTADGLKLEEFKILGFPLKKTPKSGSATATSSAEIPSALGAIGPSAGHAIVRRAARAIVPK